MKKRISVLILALGIVIGCTPSAPAPTPTPEPKPLVCTKEAILPGTYTGSIASKTQPSIRAVMTVTCQDKAGNVTAELRSLGEPCAIDALMSGTFSDQTGKITLESKDFVTMSGRLNSTGNALNGTVSFVAGSCGPEQGIFQLLR